MSWPIETTHGETSTATTLSEKLIEQLHLQTKITDLPDDVILTIVETLCRHCAAQDGHPGKIHRADHKALIAFSQTCSRFNRLARSYVFHSIYLSYDYLSMEDVPVEETRRDRCMVRLLETLSGAHTIKSDGDHDASDDGDFADGVGDLARAVRHLELNLTPISSSHPRKTCCNALIHVMWEWLPQLLNKLPNLQHLELTMEHPLNKLRGFAVAMQEFGRESYDSIKTLSLVYRADGNRSIIDMDLRHTEMLLGRCWSLSTLEIYGMGGIGRDFPEAEFKFFENLSTLRLINCSLTLYDLTYLVSHCRSLETFVFGRGDFRKFQCMARYGWTVDYPEYLQCTPLQIIRELERWSTKTLKHLELKAFEEAMWERVWDSEAPSHDAEALDRVRGAVIKSLRQFTELETLQLPQDAILGIPTVGPAVIDGSTFHCMCRRKTILPDDLGTRLLEVLPRTLRSLRLTNANQHLAASLLNFVSAVSDGEFPLLRKVALHGEDQIADVWRHDFEFRPEMLASVERHWPFLQREFLEAMGDKLAGAGVGLSWEAMESAEPPSGWRNWSFEEWIGLVAPPPPDDEEEMEFMEFSVRRRGIEDATARTVDQLNGWFFGDGGPSGGGGDDDEHDENALDDGGDGDWHDEDAQEDERYNEWHGVDGQNGGTDDAWHDYFAQEDGRDNGWHDDGAQDDGRGDDYWEGWYEENARRDGRGIEWSGCLTPGIDDAWRGYYARNGARDNEWDGGDGRTGGRDDAWHDYDYYAQGGAGDNVWYGGDVQDHVGSESTSEQDQDGGV